MKKVGIMGGTFDPVHIGHLIIAEKAREQFHLEEVLFMPSGVPYMKSNKKVLPAEIRTEMTKLAIADNPFFTISTLEVEKEGSTYTYETLRELRAENQSTKYYFILGADSLWTIKDWKNPEEIFRNCHLLAAPRNDKTVAEMETQAAYLRDAFHAEVSILQTCHIAISSSMIRDLIQNGNSIRYLVPEAVCDYIIKNKLYKSEG